MRAKLTRRVVEALEGDALVWDTEVPPLAVRCRKRGDGTPGPKRYVVTYRQGRGRGAPRRWHTLGVHGLPGPDGELLVPETARAEALRILSVVKRGGDPAGDRAAVGSTPTLEAFWRRYREEHSLVRKKPRTVLEEDRLAARHILPALGPRRLEDITRDDVAALHRARQHQPGGANRTLALLAHVFQAALEWGVLPEGHGNPCRYVKAYRTRGRERYLTDSELQRLGAAIAASSAPAQSVAALLLLVFTGCRKGEVLGLRWGNVDFERRVLHLVDTKTGDRSVPLNAPAVAALEDLRGHHELAPGPDARVFGVASIEGTWRSIRRAAGLEDVRLHDLRHSFASIGAGAGQSLKVLGGLLGHSRATTTDRYAHLADDPLRAATEAIGERIAGAMGPPRRRRRR